MYSIILHNYVNVKIYINFLIDFYLPLIPINLFLLFLLINISYKRLI